MSDKRVLSGKPSVDRPWMQYYPDMLMQMIKQPNCTVNQYLRGCCPGMDVDAIHYYGEDISWKTVFEQADKTARALKAMGFGEGDQIPVYLGLSSSGAGVYLSPAWR